MVPYAWAPPLERRRLKHTQRADRVGGQPIIVAGSRELLGGLPVGFDLGYNVQVGGDLQAALPWRQETVINPADAM
jgi:hypothetical protein